MPRKYPEDPSRRQRRRALGRLTPSEIPCIVPGCPGGRVTEQCCYRHSIDISVERGTFLRNDGIVDGLAIDLARTGSRVVELTWVEFEIAVAHMINDGLSYAEIRNRTGIKSKLSRPRIKNIEGIAYALVHAA